jgi:hypothetical protein
MAKRGFLFAAGMLTLGGVVTLAIGEAANPGSSRPIVQAGTDAAVNAENGGAIVIGNGAVQVGNVAGNAMQGLQASGIGGMFNGAVGGAGGAADPTAVPAAPAPAAPPAAD